jgi:hypothetical protein
MSTRQGTARCNEFWYESKYLLCRSRPVLSVSAFLRKSLWGHPEGMPRDQHRTKGHIADRKMDIIVLIKSSLIYYGAELRDIT